MAVDWDNLVIGPCIAAFGVPVEYRPASWAAFTAMGVFDKAYHPVQILDGTPVMSSEVPLLGMRLADFPAGVIPRKGDQVAIPSDGNLYTVKEAPHKDGHGHVKIMLTIKSDLP